MGFRKKIRNKYLSILTDIFPILNVKLLYKRRFGRPYDDKNPLLFNEKIHWLELHNYQYNSLVKQCADKYAVRDYVKLCGCENILNEMIGVYESVEEIPWDALPKKFVLKWNFGCHHNLIVTDKNKLDIESAKRDLKNWGKTHNSWWKIYAELHYKDIPPKLICEKFIETSDGQLPVDYKLYCFNGEPHCIMICENRDTHGGNASFFFLDEKGNILPYNRTSAEMLKNNEQPIAPEGMQQLFAYARKLTKGFPFVRADFYLEKDKITFGELTFTPAAGYDVNILPEARKILGGMINHKGK